jgi:glyoxylase-like metal-dependent hydrolase (beta-lactamase superfamily II)
VNPLAFVYALGVFAGQQPDFDKVEIKVNKVAGSVYMLEGAGGNIGVSVGEDGIVVIDDEFAPLAPKIRAALKGITDKPVRFLLNTHWHGDHTGGNEKFGQEATIIAHDNVRKRLLDGAPGRSIAGRKLDPIPPAPKVALPVITFEDKVSVHLNGEDIRAIHFPHGHTDGDSVIFFPQSKVVHMGDDFVTYGFPFIDLASGGSVKGLIANLDKLIPEVPADAKIIPGHGAISTVEDLKKFAATLKEIVATIEAGVKKGKTADALKKEKVLAKWDATWGKAFIKADDFIDIVCADLAASHDQKFMKH